MSVFLAELFKTDKKASFKSWFFKTGMNLYPMFFATGGRIQFWSADWHEVHLKLSLNVWTYNYVGTIFGGSMFSVTDPFYMVMLNRILGNNYVVWDKSATIRFRRPGKKNLYCRLLVLPEMVEEIKRDIAEKGETEKTFKIQWFDKDQIVYAELDRLVYAASKSFYKEKLKLREAKNKTVQA